MKIKKIKRIVDLIGTTDGFGHWKDRIYDWVIYSPDLRKNPVDFIMDSIREFMKEVIKSNDAEIYWIDFDTVEIKCHQKNRDWYLRFELETLEFTYQTFILEGNLVEVYTSESNELTVYVNGRKLPINVKSIDEVIRFIRQCESKFTKS